CRLKRALAVMSQDCLFCKITAGEIPSEEAFEDPDVDAFHDIKPAARGHILLVPKEDVIPMRQDDDGDGAWLGKMMVLANKIAHENGCRPGPEGGFRLVANSGVAGGQEIDHLHLHILGGARPWAKRAAPAA